MRALFLLLLLTACAGLPGSDTSPLTLAERYDRVALHGDDGTAKPDVLRWEAPVAWYLDADAATRQRWHGAVAAQMAELEVLTGLDFTEGPAEIANYFIFMRPTSEMRRGIEAGRLSAAFANHFRQSNCSGAVTDLPWLAAVLIPTDLDPAVIQNCIVQETSQALGLPGDINGRSDTVFASRSRLPALSPADRDLIRLHYSRGIRDGMPAAEVRAYVRQITSAVQGWTPRPGGG